MHARDVCASRNSHNKFQKQRFPDIDEHLVFALPELTDLLCQLPDGTKVASGVSTNLYNVGFHHQVDIKVEQHVFT